MSIDKNIKNAVQVLYHTYDNVSKLMEACSTTAKEAGYVPAVQKFLRWKSDNDSNGWLVNSFILLFQDATDPPCETGNDWRNGPVYVLEICLGKKENPNYEPQVHLSKFEYEDISGWSVGCSPANHWVFHYPVHGESIVNVNWEGDYRVALPNSAKSKQTYWGMKKVVSVSVRLTDIKADNLKKLVFGTFDTLKDITGSPVGRR